MEKKISVIIPVYNVERFVSKCIKSAINQSYKNLEIILVDDGSTDKSGLICDSYAKKDSRIIVIHKENEGVSSARNSGLDIATGEYVCFIDGDDYVMPDYVDYLYSLIYNNDADISITTKMYGNFDNKKENNDMIKIWNNEDAVEAILCYNVPIGCYCKLFKREILKNIRFIPEVFIGEGFNFNVDSFQHSGKIVVGCHKCYYYRRDNPTSAMTKFNIKKCVCGLKALQIIKNNLIINSERINKAWLFANWRTHSDFYDMIVLADTQHEYPDMYRRCLSVVKKNAFTALSVPASKQNKVRAVVMKFAPALIPFAMKLRKRKYRVDV